MNTVAMATPGPGAIAVCGGVVLVLVVFADLVNTLVSTFTSYGRWWPSRLIGRSTFVAIRSVARRLPDDSKWRERMLAVFGPLLVIELLFAWALLQIVGSGLI